MRRRRNTPYVIGFFVVWLCFGVAGFVFGYYYSPERDSEKPLHIVEENTDDETRQQGIDINNFENNNELEEKPVSSYDLVVGEDTKVVFRTLYEKCQETNDEVKKPLNEMLGLKEKDFKEYTAQNLKEWQMVRFSGDEIVLFQRKNQVCPNHFLVSQEDGYIAIYKYDEEGKKNLVEKTQIPISVLPKLDQDKLNRGILLPTREEVNQLLEDYSG